MKKKHLFWLLGILVLAAVVVLAILVGGPSKLFQGALYNLRPIYTSCHIVSANFKSDNLSDCELFDQKFLANKFPEGEYTITAEYVDKRLPKNIIPLKISRNKLQCNFLEKGYVPKFKSKVFDPQTQRTFSDIDPVNPVLVSTEGTVIQLTYEKDKQSYFYDTNICESAFQGQISDNSDTALGFAKMDHNGFISSRSLTNEVLINDFPYYQDEKGKSVKKFHPGNIFLRLSPGPETIFKMTIPCSKEIPQVKVPNIETTKPVEINFQGISKEYFTNCGPRLYFSLQNTNRYDDIQIIDTPELVFQGDTTSYLLDPAKIARVLDINTVFPLSFKLSMHLRDRSDSNEVFTLGSGIVTIPSYKAKPQAVEKIIAQPTTQPVVGEVATDLPKVRNQSSDTVDASATADTNTDVPIDDVATTAPADAEAFDPQAIPAEELMIEEEAAAPLNRYNPDAVPADTAPSTAPADAGTRASGTSPTTASDADPLT